MSDLRGAPRTGLVIWWVQQRWSCTRCTLSTNMGWLLTDLHTVGQVAATTRTPWTPPCRCIHFSPVAHAEFCHSTGGKEQCMPHVQLLYHCRWFTRTCPIADALAYREAIATPICTPRQAPRRRKCVPPVANAGSGRPLGVSKHCMNHIQVMHGSRSSTIHMCARQHISPPMPLSR